MSSNRQASSVSGIIFSPNRKKVLLVKRRDIPVWVLPGGGIEPGESPLQASQREVEEETGYRVVMIRKIAEYTPVCNLARFTHFYEYAIVGGEASIGEETADIAFFPLNALPFYLPPPYPDWIDDAKREKATLLRKPISSVTYKALCTYGTRHPLLTIRFLFLFLKWKAQ